MWSMGSPSVMGAPATDTPALCTVSSPGWHTSPHPLPLCSQCGTMVAQSYQRRYHTDPPRRLFQCGGSLGLQTKHTSARSLQAGGAMVILIGNIDTDTIRIIRRWHSVKIMRYLHVIAQPHMQGHAATMFDSRDYTLIPATTSLPSDFGSPAG